MKFFGKLLATPAAIGLLATGADVKADDFSTTTTLSGEANFTAGAVTIQDNPDHELHMIYSYKVDSITSFSGDDALKVSVETGNAPTSTRILTEGVVYGDSSLKVSNLYYTTSLSEDLLLAVGPLFEMDALVSTTTSSYSNDGIFNGWWYGPNNYSNHPKSGAPGIAMAYMDEGGFNAGFSTIWANGADPTKGIGNDDGFDVTTLSIGYDGDSFGGGLIYTLYDDPADLFETVYDENGNAITASLLGDPVFIGAGGYWNVNDKFDVSLGIDFLEFDYQNYEQAVIYSLGADYDLGPGTLSGGVASVLGYDTSNGNQDNAGTAYEAYYNWDVADGITVKPMIMIHSLDSSGSTNWADETMYGVETTFKF